MNRAHDRWPWGVVAAALLSACGAPALHVTDDFVVLEDDPGPYDERATTARGVVVAVREADNRVGGSLAFWVEAIESQLRLHGGYALLETREVRSADGVPGSQMRFGRDESGRPFAYWVTVFVTDRSLHVLEAGGRQDRFEEARAAVEQTIARFEVR